MILEPQNPQVKAIAIMLEDGLQKGPMSEEFAGAHKTIDMQIDSFLQKMHSSPEQGPRVMTPKFINDLSPAEFWSLVYLGVKNDLDAANANRKEEDRGLSYTLASAINTLTESRPELESLCINQPLSLVDITNIVFETEYDLLYVHKAVDVIFEILNNMQAAQELAGNVLPTDLPKPANN